MYSNGGRRAASLIRVDVAAERWVSRFVLVTAAVKASLTSGRAWGSGAAVADRHGARRLSSKDIWHSQRLANKGGDEAKAQIQGGHGNNAVTCLVLVA